jgi:hypothetical protein
VFLRALLQVLGRVSGIRITPLQIAHDILILQAFVRKVLEVDHMVRQMLTVVMVKLVLVKLQEVFCG